MIHRRDAEFAEKLTFGKNLKGSAPWSSGRRVTRDSNGLSYPPIFLHLRALRASAVR